MKEKSPKTFEENLNTLQNLVTELEQGEIDLDKAIEKYSEAMKLAKDCGDKLNTATESVNKILAENGKLEDFKIPDAN
jgi:exodeoxyribonuclease VII small subunit